MLVLNILKVVQIALTVLMVCGIALALLMIASYAKEELENNAAAKALFNRIKSTLKTLMKPMIAEFPPLYDSQSSQINIRSWLNKMATRRLAPSTPKYSPRHTHVAQGNVFEDGFESFVRGFDRNGGLLEKRAPRHAAGLVGSPKYLKMHDDLAYALRS